ncbi:MAG: hypothetical protein P8188_15430 [Gemmatimonadota bacterium]
MHRIRLPLVALLAVLLLGGCAVYHSATRRPAAEMEVADAATDLPLQAYLTNGEIVRFETGARRVGDRIEGSGTRYTVGMEAVGTVTALPLDSVVGLEVLQGRQLNVPMTVLASAAGTALAVAAVGGLAVAIFGSCPTVYVPAPVPGDEAPVAELFSYSVAPLLEARDVDLYPGGPEEGRLRLDFRNEALETHFINHLELLEVRHRPGETVVPTGEDQPLAVSGWMEGARFTDRAGRDQGDALARSGSGTYRTPEAFVTGATLAALEDWIEIEVPRRPATDSVAIVLRLRNSLLNSVFLYDFMLSGDDLRGLDWLGHTLQEVGSAAAFGGWYQRRMGLHVDVWREGRWIQVDRIPDTGPIAWKEAAVMLPVPAGAGPLRYRLRFVADQWRIDQVRLAGEVRRPEVVAHPVTAVQGADGRLLDDAVRALRDPDEDYLETRPGTALWVDFEVGEEQADTERAFLIAAQGYYTEWIRPDWIRPGSGPPDDFVPGDAGLLQVLERWHEVRPWFEARFHDSRLSTDRRAER